MPNGVASDFKTQYGIFPPHPLFVERAKGSKIYDNDGNEYIDYCLGAGPAILGHGHPKVIEAIKRQLDEGGTLGPFGAEDELAVKLAKKIKERYTHIDSLRFTSSGVEATSNAIRVARAYAKRDKIARFEGQYHGTHDYFLVSNLPPPPELDGDPSLPPTIPGSAGIPQSVLDDVVTLPFNDLDACEKIIKRYRNQLAAVIMSPIHSYSVLLPRKGFLEGIREITEKHNIVLISDEVFLGYRVPPEFYGITPDLVTLGKIIGGGLPSGAFGGRRELMETLSGIGVKKPQEKVFHSGTFSGSPLVSAAGLATLNALTEDAYRQINNTTAELVKGIKDILKDNKIDAQIPNAYSTFDIVFTSSELNSWRDILKADVAKRRMMAYGLVNRGILFYISPHWVVTSLAHTKEDVEKTLESVAHTVKELRE